jgi:hypothetical protein
MRFPLALFPVMLLVTAACQELPTSDASPPQLAAAAAAGPITINMGEGESTYSGYTVSCNGELIAIEARQRWRYQVIQHPTGDWMLKDHLVVHIDGIGVTTGVKYVGSGVYNVTQVFAMPLAGAFTYSQSSHQVGITQGPSENSAFTVLATWTIDATGKVSNDSFRVEWECRG